MLNLLIFREQNKYFFFVYIWWTIMGRFCENRYSWSNQLAHSHYLWINWKPANAFSLYYQLSVHPFKLKVQSKVFPWIMIAFCFGLFRDTLFSYLSFWICNLAVSPQHSVLPLSPTLPLPLSVSLFHSFELSSILKWFSMDSFVSFQATEATNSEGGTSASIDLLSTNEPIVVTITIAVTLGPMSENAKHSPNLKCYKTLQQCTKTLSVW